MTNTTNQTITLAKGVARITQNNLITHAIRNLDQITYLAEGKAEFFVAMDADCYSVKLKDENNEMEFFFEPTANAPGIDCLNFEFEPNELQKAIISLVSECLFNKSGLDLGERIREINTIPVISNDADFEKLSSIITDIETLIVDENFYPKAEMKVEEEALPIYFSAKKKIMPIPFLDGYSVSDEKIVPKAEQTPSQSTEEEIASAVVAPIFEEVNTQNETVETTKPELTLIKNDEVALDIPNDVPTQVSLFEEDIVENKAFNPLSMVIDGFTAISNLDDLDAILNSTELDILEVGDLVEFSNSIGLSYKDIATQCEKSYSTIYKLQSRSYILEKNATAKNNSLVLVVNAIGSLLFSKYKGFAVDYKGKVINLVENIFKKRDDKPVFVISSNPQSFNEVKQNVSNVQNNNQQTAVQQVPVQQAPIQQVYAQQPVVSVVETKGPSRPKVLPIVEGNIIVKVSSILKTLSLMEVKASKVNPNILVLNDVINNFLELDSPNTELVQNLKAIVSTLAIKKEHYSEDLFKTSVMVASSIATMWLEAFKTQSPSEASSLDSVLNTFSKEKEIDLSGHTYTLEELKVLRPKFFDDTWVVTLLKKFDVSKVVINEILAERAERRDFLIENHLNDIILVEADFKFIGKPSKVRRAINNIHGCHHMLATGDTGCGKTTLIESLSCLTNKPMYKISGNTSTNSESFLGFNTLSDNEIEFVTGLAVRAMRVGGMLYVDEINTIKANVLAILYPLLDHSQGIYNDLTGEFEKSKKGFVMAGSYNPGYTDTNEVSSALIGRTVGLKLGYMSSQELEAYLMNIDNSVDAITIKKLSAIFKILTENLGGVDLPPAAKSTRHIITILHKIKDGRQTLAESLEDILDNLPEDDASLVFNALTPIKDVLGIEVTGTSIIQKSI